MNNSCTFTQRLSELNAVDSLCKTAPYTKCMPTQIVFTNQISVSHLTSALKATFHSCNFEGTQKYNRTLTKAQQHVYLHGVNCMHKSARTRDPNSNPRNDPSFGLALLGLPRACRRQMCGVEVLSGRYASVYCRDTSKCLQSCWGLKKLVLVS